MITQELQHPDVLGWEVDEDLRRANMILTARSTVTRRMQHQGDVDYSRRDAKIEYIPKKADHRFATGSHGFDALKQANDIEELVGHPAATSRKESSDYPPSPQGGWRPWIFAATGFIGGNIAMTMGGVSPNYLPTIIISEIVLGIVICIAFYPKTQSRQAIL